MERRVHGRTRSGLLLGEALTQIVQIVDNRRVPSLLLFLQRLRVNSRHHLCIFGLIGLANLRHECSASLSRRLIVNLYARTVPLQLKPSRVNSIFLS